MAYILENPLGVNNLEDIFRLLSGRIMEIVIPIAVLMYVWAGVNLLIAAGRPAYISRAKEIFQYTTVGLLVIFIGGGFVDLIRGILNVGQ
jgi:Type IV secretion system pilin